MKAAELKTKKCRICRKTFNQWNSLQFCCSVNCAYAWSEKQRLKREYLQAIEGTKPRKAETVSQQHELTQSVFNRWVRLVKEKDANACISCGRTRGGFVEEAGHFKTVGSAGILRYEPDNCFLQCHNCNHQLSGNIVEYRAALVQKIGVERVEWLDSEATKSKKWIIAELKDMRAKLSKEIREVEQ